MRIPHAAIVLALAAAPRPAPAQTQPGALILSPDPGERISADQVLVAVTLPQGADSAVSVRVGSRDVSAEAERTGGVVTWRPREPLAPGPHRVVVTARGADGAALPPVEWTFTVAPAPRLAAAVPAAAPRPRSPALPHGTLVMHGAGSSASGPGAAFRREEDFAPRMWLTAGGQLRPGWRYSLRGHLSGYESEHRQPVNRLRAEIRTPGVTLALGDVNPVLHDVILVGRRVRGGQLDLRAGPAGLSVVAGQSLRPVSGTLDPLDRTSVLRRGTFGQALVAVRPSLGARGFRVGLTVMRVRDDAGSIPALRTDPAANSGTVSANPAPRDNLVAGLDASLRLARGRFVLQYENAASLLARDISTRPASRAELDSIFVAAGADPPGIDPARYDRFFILNTSLLPLDPRKLTSTAHQARASLRAGGHQLSAEWRQVGMDYYTLGRPGLQRDWRGLRVRDSFSMLRDALFVTVGYEHDRDNLDGSGPTTTNGRGGFATVTWQAPRDVVVTGSLRLARRENGLAEGVPGALNQSTVAASGGMSVPVGVLASFRTRVSLNGTLVERADPSNPLAETRDVYVLAGVQGETESRGTSVSLLAGRNRAEFPGLPGGNTTFDRLAAAGRHQLTVRWAARFDGGWTAARSPESATTPGPRYTRTEALGGGEFAWRPDAVVSLTAGVVDYADDRVPGLDTRELVLRLSLSRAF
jgi:hypothetical protein